VVVAHTGLTVVVLQKRTFLKYDFYLTEGEEGADNENGTKKKEVSKTSLKVTLFLRS